MAAFEVTIEENAVKYTDRGSITVRVSTIALSDSVAIEVEDTGMGIAEHLLASIFDPFMQVHKTSTENSRGGIGLGLSIVKKHVEQIKGTISVKSELGKGSTFRIVLPRDYDKPHATGLWPFSLLRNKFRRSGSPQEHSSRDTGSKRSAANHALN